MKMKTNLIILFILILSINSYGQVTKENNSDWKIGVKFSYDNNSSSRKIVNSQYTGHSLDFDKFNYTTGIKIEKKIFNKFSIISGLEYSNKDYTGTFYCDVCTFIVATKPRYFELQFVQIPTSLKYEYQINSFSLFALGGITNSFTVKNQLNEKDYLLGMNIGLGIAYEIYENWILELTSEYNNSLTKLYKDESFDQKYTGIGIAIKKGF
jgi:hypothetical protein